MRVLARVVEVIGAGRGSGYAVGADLILTAAHVVAGRDDCQVRPTDAVDPLPATVVWRDERVDAALLRLGSARWPGLTTSWGRVSGVRLVGCVATGFPWAQRQADGSVAEEMIHATVVPGTAHRLGRYAINVTTAQPYDPPDGRSPWRGMSGAGLLAQDGHHLLGVLVDDPQRFQPSRLEAVPVEYLLADAGFAALVGISPRRLVQLPPHPFLRPAYQPLPRRPSDPQLLMPQFGVVPFLGRETLVDELVRWASDDDPLAVALVSGAGGSGKTRLAAEVCERVLAMGWDAGRVVDLGSIEVDALEWPSLIVVDYAEQADSQALRRLLAEVANRPDGPTVRVLLLARDVGHWWDTVSPAVGTYTGTGEAVRFHLGDHALSGNERSAHAAVAAAEFAARLDLAVPVAPDVTSPELDSPLLIHMAALLAVRGEYVDAASGAVRRRILVALLDRERQRWSALLPAHRLGGPEGLHPATVQRVVLCVTLARPHRTTVASLLAVLPELAGEAQVERRDKAARWLDALFSDGVWGPDLLVGQLLGETGQQGTDSDLGSIATRLLAYAEFGDASVAHLLNTVRLAAEHHLGPRMVLTDLMIGHLTGLVGQIHEGRDTSLIGALTAAAILCDAYGDRADELADAAAEAGGMIGDADPRSTPLLLALAMILTREYRRQCDSEQNPDADPDLFRPYLAEGLSRVARYWSDLGRPDEALPQIREAVAVFRALTETDPDQYRSWLARSLDHLGATLTELGRSDEALPVADEAVTIYRMLAEAEPDRHLDGLAVALNSLGIHWSMRGDPDRALPAGVEAVAIARTLTETGPAGYRDMLALFLSHLGVRLAEVGRSEEALGPTREAVAIFRELAEADPDRHREHLAGSLTNLGARLSEVGRLEEAVPLVEEAVAHLRSLARETPDRYQRRLAHALNNLAKDRADLGEGETALPLAEEAAAILTALAAADPDRYGPDLARCLKDLSDCLLGLGRHNEALLPMQDAVTILGPLAETDPDRYRPDLASCLSDLGACLWGLGWYDEALAPMQEAVALYRLLAEADPTRYRPKLARSLDRLGLGLSRFDAGRALPPAQEAVAIYRASAADDPHLHSDGLAASLTNLGARLSGLGRWDEGVPLAEEAVAIYRVLVDADPHLLPNLAGSLGNLGSLLSDRDHPERVLALSEEAVAIFRVLDRDNPHRFRNDLAIGLTNLSQTLRSLGRIDQALATAEEAVELYAWLTEAQPDHYLADLARATGYLSHCRAEAGQPDTALDAAYRAFEYTSQMAEPDQRMLIQCMELLSLRLSAMGDASQAMSWQRQAVSAATDLDGSLGDTRPDLVRTLDRLAELLAQAERPGPARLAREIATKHQAQLALEAAGNPGWLERRPVRVTG